MALPHKTTESAGGVVLNVEGKVLVVNQHGSSWSLPKGHLDPGEDALTAARREIYEESGISEVVLIRELGWYERFRIGQNGGEDRSEFKKIYMFLFKTSQDKLAPVDPHNPQAVWVDRAKVAGLLTHPKDRAFFESVVENISKEIM